MGMRIREFAESQRYPAVLPCLSALFVPLFLLVELLSWGQIGVYLEVETKRNMGIEQDKLTAGVKTIYTCISSSEEFEILNYCIWCYSSLTHHWGVRRCASHLLICGSSGFAKSLQCGNRALNMSIVCVFHWNRWRSDEIRWAKSIFASVHLQLRQGQNPREALAQPTSEGETVDGRFAGRTVFSGVLR